MADETGQILWFSPDPRAILPIRSFHTPRRLARTTASEPFTIEVNKAFAAVVTACAEPGSGRESTWLSPDLITAYIRLHDLGFAHSVEAWQDGALVGGLYGVAINSFFAGESMFSRVRDASKVALVHLVRRLQERRFMLLDIQFMTDHLAQFGAVEISRSEYQVRLSRALQQRNQFK
jgi:leucyl/phenylalanyl-tRNA--protein transferase